MFNAPHLSLLVLSVFVAIFLLQIVMNPASLTEAPTSEDSMAVVDKTAAQSIAIFSIVLVVIQFILDGIYLNQYDLLTVNVLVLSAGFLMVTFIMELFGGVRVFFFHLQITALRYSGLLLFLGLYFLLLSKSLPNFTSSLFGVFVGVAWATWIIHEIHYMAFIQRKEWSNKDQTRKEWVRMIVDR